MGTRYGGHPHAYIEIHRVVLLAFHLLFSVNLMFAFISVLYN